MKLSKKKQKLTTLKQIERGQWAVCYTSPQSFEVTFTSLLA